jgi:hypothetical protein
MVHIQINDMNEIKQRLINNWTIQRALYVIIGVFLIVQSVYDRLWFGIFFGGYFAAMGLFAFGCAAGSCYGNDCRTETHTSDAVKQSATAGEVTEQK